MASIKQILVNSEKHSGPIEVFQNPSSTCIANFTAGTSFNTVKMHAIGEGVVPYNAGDHYVIRPKLFPQVTCHAIFKDGKTQISNKTPFGKVHIIFESNTFTLKNQHEGDLHIKYTPPKNLASASAMDTKYLGSFSDAENLKKGDSQTYKSDRNYAIRSTLDSNPANIFNIDFVNDKIHLSNGNPAGEIAIALKA